jgi:hypothetical protein
VTGVNNASTGNAPIYQGYSSTIAIYGHNFGASGGGQGTATVAILSGATVVANLGALTSYDREATLGYQQVNATLPNFLGPGQYVARVTVGSQSSPGSQGGFCLATCSGRQCGQNDSCNGVAGAYSQACYANTNPDNRCTQVNCGQCQVDNAQGTGCQPGNENGSCNPGTGGTGVCHSGTCVAPFINAGITDSGGGSLESGDVATLYGSGLDAGAPTIYLDGSPIPGGPHFYYGIGCGGGCTQINFDVPTTVATGSHQIYIRNNNGTSNSQSVNITGCNAATGSGIPCTQSYTVAGQPQYCRNLNSQGWQWVTITTVNNYCSSPSQVCQSTYQCASEFGYCVQGCGGGLTWRPIAPGTCNSSTCYP